MIRPSYLFTAWKCVKTMLIPEPRKPSITSVNYRPFSSPSHVQNSGKNNLLKICDKIDYI